MDHEGHLPIEQMELFRRYVTVADWTWDLVMTWDALARDTVGKQLVRACDSIGANLVEGDGRYGDADALHFFIIARASARETRYWLERAVNGKLVSPETGEEKLAEVIAATQLLNRLISYRRRRARKDRVADERATYEVTDPDPFIEP